MLANCTINCNLIGPYLAPLPAQSIVLCIFWPKGSTNQLMVKSTPLLEIEARVYEKGTLRKCSLLVYLLMLTFAIKSEHELRNLDTCLKKLLAYLIFVSHASHGVSVNKFK